MQLHQEEINCIVLHCVVLYCIVLYCGEMNAFFIKTQIK